MAEKIVTQEELESLLGKPVEPPALRKVSFTGFDVTINCDLPPRTHIIVEGGHLTINGHVKKGSVIELRSEDPYHMIDITDEVENEISIHSTGSVHIAKNVESAFIAAESLKGGRPKTTPSDTGNVEIEGHIGLGSTVIARQNIIINTGGPLDIGTSLISLEPYVLELNLEAKNDIIVNNIAYCNAEAGHNIKATNVGPECTLTARDTITVTGRVSPTSTLNAPHINQSPSQSSQRNT
jgi:hypothetical protein